MADPIELANDVLTGATALGGLILVYLGSVVSAFGACDAQQKRSVVAAFRKRAWFAFVGFAVAILSALCALAGKWLHVECVAGLSIVLLFISLVLAIGTGWATVQEIK